MARRLCATLPFWVLCVAPSLAQYPTTPAEIAQYLVKADYDSRVRGLGGYVRLPADERTPEVRDALIESLRIENERRRQFHLSDAPYLYEGDDTSALILAGEVTKLRDPRTIPVLLPWLCCGFGKYLIDFERLAFEPVLEFTEAEIPGTENAIWGGLRTLRLMVDHWGLASFTATEQERLVALASRHIEGLGAKDGNGWSELQDAIELAGSLRATELLQVAQALVHDEAALDKRGIFSELDMRAWLKQSLSDAIAGVPNRFPYVPYEER